MEKAPSETMPLRYMRQAIHLTPAQNLSPPPSTPHCLSADPWPGTARVLDGVDQSEIPAELAVSGSPVSISDGGGILVDQTGLEKWVTAVALISVS